MTKKQKMIIGCIPCLDGMKKGYVPYQNSTVGRCSRCDLEVWVGPAQKKQHETHGYPIVCLRCVLEEYGPDAMSSMQPLTKKGREE